MEEVQPSKNIRDTINDIDLILNGNEEVVTPNLTDTSSDGIAVPDESQKEDPKPLRTKKEFHKTTLSAGPYRDVPENSDD